MPINGLGNAEKGILRLTNKGPNLASAVQALV